MSNSNFIDIPSIDEIYKDLLEHQNNELESLIETKTNLVKKLGQQNDSIKENIKKHITKLQQRRDELSTLYNNKQSQFQHLNSLPRQSKEIQKQYIKQLFDIYFVKTKALIYLPNYFDKNSRETSNGKIQKQSMKISLKGTITQINSEYSDTEIYPYLLKNSIFQNKILILKLNRFFNMLSKFLLMLSINLNIALPHKIEMQKILSNKNKRHYEYYLDHSIIIDDNPKKINIYIAYYLLHFDYNYIIKKYFDIPDVDFNWFNMSPFISDEDLQKISQCDDDLDISIKTNIAFDFELL